MRPKHKKELKTPRGSGALYFYSRSPCHLNILFQRHENTQRNEIFLHSSLCSRAIQYQYLFKTNKLHNSIVTENRVNLPNGFRLAVAQFLAKFDAVALLQSFRHFPCNEKSTRALHTTSLKCCLPATDAIDRREKIYACALRFKVGSCKRARL